MFYNSVKNILQKLNIKDKKQIFRYFVYFILISIVIFFALEYLKQSKVGNIIQRYKTLHYYNTYLEEIKKTAELIYFDEIIKDDKLASIFQNENTAEVLLELYDNFEPRFAYYRVLGLFDISFYSISNEHILNFQDINFQDNFVLNLVEKVIVTKKDILELKNSQSDTYIVLVKPIIDNELNLLGVVSFEFDFNNILEKLNNTLGVKYKKVILNNNQKSDEPVIEIFKSSYPGHSLYLQLEDLKNKEKQNSWCLWLFIFSIICLGLSLYILYKTKFDSFKDILYNINLRSNLFKKLFKICEKKNLW